MNFELNNIVAVAVLRLGRGCESARSAGAAPPANEKNETVFSNSP